MGKKEIIHVSNLTVQRGSTIILRDFNWRVQAGEHWVILGANGSGKTSLLSALTGYLTPSEGEVDVLGERYGEADWRELRKVIGLVSSSVRQMIREDETALDVVLSGKEAVINFWGRAKAEDRKRAMQILKRVECGYLAQREWCCLSQGERQRVLIGRALMARPHLLILDEPCAGLDPVAREHFLDFLNRLPKNTSSPTLILVTHHVEEIMPVFSHVLLVKAGRPFASGTVSRVLRSNLLSQALNSSVRIHRQGKRYALSVFSNRRVVV